MNLIILFFSFVIVSSSNALSMGPVGKINFDVIYECEEPVTTDKMQLKLNLKTVDSKGTKGIYATLKQSIPIDSNIKYEIRIVKWDNSGWKPALVRKGKLCDDMFRFAGDVITKVANKLDPAIAAECPVPPGEYTLENFQILATDFNIPVVYYGKLKLTTKLFLGDEVLVCTVAEANSQSPFR